MFICVMLHRFPPFYLVCEIENKFSFASSFITKTIYMKHELTRSFTGTLVYKSRKMILNVKNSNKNVA